MKRTISSLLLSVMMVAFVAAQDKAATATDTLSIGQQVAKRFFSGDHEIDEEGKPLEKKKMEGLDYIPEIHGTIRAKYEYCPQLNESRFQVRNARLSITGNVHPIVAYKAEIDLSDRGTIKMLDAYVRVFPVKGLALTLGQMKVPFSTDNLRSPHLLYFANRSFITKQVSGFRDVGFTVAYDAKAWFPMEISAGVFNGSGLTAQTEWQKHMDYSARFTMTPVKYFSFSLNWQSIQPAELRMNLFDIGMIADFYGVHLEAEGLYKIYDKNQFAPSYGANAFVAYDLLLPKVFHKIRFGLRYDMMSNNNRGQYTLIDEQKVYEITDYARQRLTAGITLSIAKPVLAELRINYEKYFYSDWSVASPDEQDKLVIELVGRF
ncbi:MAG: OprO/OprP family phosphate-selective porin [Bacteroidales bacterium]|nr:OprO/OprP family phosphate-selective porin [Bacteroidales bacterium]